jgi:ABC-2 type transport system ATP-binding protein
VSRREFWKLLAQFLDRGVTILMSTPYLDEAERCTRVALIHEGRLLAADTPERLRDVITGPMFEIVPGGVNPSDAADIVRAIPGVADVQIFGERLHVTVSGGDSAGPKSTDQVAAALRPTPLAHASVRAVAPSLEDVFIARLSEEEHVDA